MEDIKSEEIELAHKRKISLVILDQIIQNRYARKRRSKTLLKDPFALTAEGWYMCIPPCFNDALDIKQTEYIVNKKKTLIWTQGASFSFKAGDTIYDALDAYKVWSEALKTINLCVQIKKVIDAKPSGLITFSILTPCPDRSKIVIIGEYAMSQDDFIRFLISGPPEELKKQFPQLDSDYVHPTAIS